MAQDSLQPVGGTGGAQGLSLSMSGSAAERVMDLERLLGTRVQDEEGRGQELRGLLRPEADEFVTAPVLVWVRYLGCPVCRHQVDELKRVEDDLYENYQAYLVLLTNSPHRSVQPFREQWGTRHGRILVDRSGDTYDAAGLRRSLGTLFRPASLRGVLRSMRQGFRHGPIEGDLRQLGGLVVLSSGAERVLYHYACQYVGDFVPIEALKRATLESYGSPEASGPVAGLSGLLAAAPS